MIGSSLALGDHLVANPRSWHLLEGAVALPTAAQLRQLFSECIAEFGTAATTVMPKLRTVYRDQLLILAALDLAPTVENEPVLPFPTVGAHLSDMADAALEAALKVAVATVCKDDTPPPRIAVIAMGKCGARELNYVSDVDVIFVGEDAESDTDHHPRRGGDDAAGVGHLLRSRRRTAARGQGRARWCAPWTPTSPTTSGGPRPGSSRPC